MALYHSSDWKALDPVDRAQLLLVIEGEKRGTIIDGDWGGFQRVVNTIGLAYLSTSRKYDIRLVAMVATPMALAAYGRAVLVPGRLDSRRLMGEFLSYPACCTDEYVRKRTPEELAAKKRKDHLHSYKFGRELDDMVKREGAYPAIFDYRPPSFTPCAIDCKNAIATLTRWKFALEWLDPEAAAELVHYNRQGTSESTVHKEYLAAYTQEHREEDRKRRQMRRHAWLSGEYNHTFPQLLKQRKHRPQPL